MDNFWGLDSQLNPWLAPGFSDEILEELCNRDWRGNRASGIRAPRIFPLAELYGVGFATRKVAGIPQFIPIPYFSDHGVTHLDQWVPAEKENRAKTHMTWHEWRAGLDLSPKRVVRITHPLVIYRRRQGIYRKPDAAGTLVFLDHSLPGVDYEPYDYYQYFEQLAKLPDRMRPRGVCIQMHDIHKGLHKRMRDFGLPLFTVGESSSDLYGPRFYDLITRFEFATSTRVGSHSYLTEEVGVRFFLWGKEIEINNPVIKAREEFEHHRKKNAAKLFSAFPPRRTTERDRWLQAALGLDVGLDESVRRIRLAVRRDLVHALWVGGLAFLNYLRGRSNLRKRAAGS